MTRPSNNLFRNLVKCLNAKSDWNTPATFKAQKTNTPKAPFSQPKPAQAHKSSKTYAGKKFA